MTNQFDGIDGTKCPHVDVAPMDGDDGLWCTRCGLKIFAREKRPCGDCQQFRGDGKACKEFPHGTVSMDSHVLYRIKERTCFVEKPHFLKKTRLKGEIRALKGLNRALGKMNKKK